MGKKVAKFPGIFPGTIAVPLDLPSLLQSADVVCKGEVVYVVDEGDVQYKVGKEPIPFTRKVAIFHVDQIYKGKIPSATIEIDILQTDFPSSLERLERGEYVLVFLAWRNQRHQLARTTTSKMPIARAPLPTVQGKHLSRGRIREALIESLSDSDESVVLAAIEQLGNLRDRSSTAFLRPLAESKNVVKRAAAVTALRKLRGLHQD